MDARCRGVLSKINFAKTSLNRSGNVFAVVFAELAKTQCSLLRTGNSKEEVHRKLSLGQITRRVQESDAGVST